MPALHPDEGLSEVIGFILILALIAALASLYLVYVVPAEGRQNEIQHMNRVNDQFTQYKMTIDGLVIANQINRAVYNTFSLGTDQISTSTGGFFNFPLFKPAGSTGAILINRRNDRVSINAEVLEQHPGVGNATINLGGDDSYLALLSGQPTHLYTNFTLTSSYVVRQANVSPSAVSENYGIHILPLGTDPPPWQVWINHTPRVDYISQDRVRFDTDLTVTVEKNGILILQETPILRGMSNQSPTNRYFVDLLDPAYGLGDIIRGPATLQRIRTSAYIEDESLSSTYGYNTIIFSDLRNPGSLEFRSGNRYFIDQNYYYQFGGVFLEQRDGMVNKITPSITLSRGVNDTTCVSIDEIVLIGTGVLGGTSPIQVQSLIAYLDRPVESPTGFANAKWVAVRVESDTDDAVRMWNETFSRIRLTAEASPNNVPPSWSTVTRDAGGSTFFIHGADTTNSTYDIELDLRRVFLNVSIQRIGTILQ